MTIEDVTFVVHWVPDGAANKGEQKDAAAWVEIPPKMPPYGSKAFKEMKIKVYFRKSFFEQAYDLAAVVVAHEFSHVVLESIGHPLRRCEKAVELTAMLLGFRRLYRSAYTERRTGGGYLTTQEVERADQILTAQHDRHAKIQLRTASGALIAGLKGLWNRTPFASKNRTAWRLGMASIALLAVAAYAITFFEPTLKKLATKTGNLSDLQTGIPAPLTREPQNTASEISVRHMDVNLAEDAKRVQQRLADLGFYSGKKDGRWGPASRKALGEFKLSNGLVLDDRWDTDTEQSLYADRPHKWMEKFIGGWATDVNDCQSAPITISPHGARSNSQVCEFKSGNREGDGWRVEAACTAVPSGEPVSRSMRLDIIESRLSLSVDRDLEHSISYVRCDPDARH